MFAVLKTGGKQYKVAQNDVMVVEKISAQSGDIVQFDNIMMISDQKVEIGVPSIEGAAVHAEVLEQSKGKKVISFVKRRRKHSSQRKRGHRQNVTVLRVQKILSSGAKKSGEQIEVGASIILANPKANNESIAKVETAKKSVAKVEKTTKPAEKVGKTTKPAEKVETDKKPVAKAEKTKKPIMKAETAKKPVTKAKVARKPVASKKD